MKPLKEFTNSKVRFVFTDIDDTLTDHGRLTDSAYSSLWSLAKKNIHVIPVTGRPAGWCELIARQWPVSGVVGENGGFYFRYDQKLRQMKRYFIFDDEKREQNRQKLLKVQNKILSQIPGAALASDQFCRLMDLAIDFCEDVDPLSSSEVQKIVDLFQSEGAQAKVSSIHVNGWFGEYDKLSMCREFLKREFFIDFNKAQDEILFIGDSPNDEPLFKGFKNSFAVKNIENFLDQIKSKPAYIASYEGGRGFSEIVEHLLFKLS